jgi:hypothetical protein
VAFGGSLFTNTFLMPPHDLFGDYFKTTFSFVTNQDIKFDLKNYPVLNKLLHEYFVKFMQIKTIFLIMDFDK